MRLQWINPPWREIWIIDKSFWIIDKGFWIIDKGFWIIDKGFWIIDKGGEMQRTPCLTIRLV